MHCAHRERVRLRVDDLVHVGRYRKAVGMTLSNPPRAALWLNVPGNCRMRSEFEIGDCDLPDIKFILGSDGDDTQLVFERAALERFVQLSQWMLAVPVAPDSPIPPTSLQVS